MSGMDFASVHLAMQGMFLVWVGLVVQTARRTLGGDGVGLPVALLLTTSFLYGGAFVYAMPGYTHLRSDGSWYLVGYQFTEWMVVQATFTSLLGVLGFSIGCGVFSPRRRRAVVPPASPRSWAHERRTLMVLGGIGLASFALHSLRISFPMSGALIELGRNLAVAAICLGGWLAWRDGRSLLPWVGIGALIPIYYIVFFGFASYGFLFGTVLASFWMAKLRYYRSLSGLRLALISTAAIYLVITAIVAWLSFREEIRRIVWQGEEGSLWGILIQALSETQWFSPWNFSALDLINIRFNLSIFIGRMIEQHALNPDLKLWGATLVILPLVILPRLIWPDKPMRGGSEFMSEHTGMVLSESTTFGTGTVFEFYVNFGMAGVFLGFIALGWVIRRIDRAGARSLARGDAIDFARWFVVGVVAIDPLLRPFFMVNGAVLAWLLMTLLKLALKCRGARPHPAATPWGQRA